MPYICISRLSEAHSERRVHAAAGGWRHRKLDINNSKSCCSSARVPDSVCGRATQAVYFETTAAGGVSWEEVEESRLRGEGAGGSGGQLRARRKLKISIPKWCGKGVVPMDEYKDGVVGAKSKNLAGVALIDDSKQLKIDFKQQIKERPAALLWSSRGRSILRMRCASRL